jgi:hypothetical protein
MHALWLVDTLPVGRWAAIAAARSPANARLHGRGLLCRPPLLSSPFSAGSASFLLVSVTIQPSYTAGDWSTPGAQQGQQSGAEEGRNTRYLGFHCCAPAQAPPHAWGGMASPQVEISGAERVGRAWSGWFAATDVSRGHAVVRARVRGMVERNSARRTLWGWSEVVELRAARAAAETRVARRHRRRCSAYALGAWRHIVYWRVQWRATAPAISRRWRACVLRLATCNWHATVVRLKRLNAAADNFRRRRSYALCAGTASRPYLPIELL